MSDSELQGLLRQRRGVSTLRPTLSQPLTRLRARSLDFLQDTTYYWDADLPLTRQPKKRDTITKGLLDWNTASMSDRQMKESLSQENLKTKKQGSQDK